jgi:hypothetical protein
MFNLKGGYQVFAEPKHHNKIIVAMIVSDFLCKRLVSYCSISYDFVIKAQDAAGRAVWLCMMMVMMVMIMICSYHSVGLVCAFGIQLILEKKVMNKFDSTFDIDWLSMPQRRLYIQAPNLFYAHSA